MKPKPKKLTTRQAWLKIARAFDGPECKHSSSGLCMSKHLLFLNGLITRSTIKQMEAQLSRYAESASLDNGWYFFNLDDRKSRAALARKFAKELKCQE